MRVVRWPAASAIRRLSTPASLNNEIDVCRNSYGVQRPSIPAAASTLRNSLRRFDGSTGVPQVVVKTGSRSNFVHASPANARRSSVRCRSSRNAVIVTGGIATDRRLDAFTGREESDLRFTDGFAVLGISTPSALFQRISRLRIAQSSAMCKVAPHG